MNTIVVDVDSTLYDFIRAFVHVSRETHGVTCGLDPQEWSALLTDFKDPAVAIATFPLAYNHQMIKFNTPYEGVVDQLAGLKRAGFNLAYYTDRPAESTAATFDWLEYYNFPTGELHICVDKRTEIMARREDVVTIVDDRPRTLIWGRYELGLAHVFSLRHGYNKNLVDIPGVHLADSWGELASQILHHVGTPDLPERLTSNRNS